MKQNPCYVFTGGPGSGKSSVITELKALGYTCAPESGRAVIQQQVEQGGDALPWANKSAFRDAMVAEDRQLYVMYSSSNKPVFFDRGIIDSYGYSILESLPVSEALLDSCRDSQYAQKVFIFPPWEDIYTNDAERKQDFAEAVRTYNVMQSVYLELGYQLVEVPKLPVQSRVEFVLSHLSSDGIRLN